MAALLFQLHPVGRGGALVFAGGDRAGELHGAAVKQQLFRQRGLAASGCEMMANVRRFWISSVMFTKAGNDNRKSRRKAKIKRHGLCPNLVVGHDVRSAGPNDSSPRRLQIRTLPSPALSPVPAALRLTRTACRAEVCSNVPPENAQNRVMRLVACRICGHLPAGNPPIS